MENEVERRPESYGVTPTPRRRFRNRAVTVLAGSVTETLCGAGTVVLAIIGLAGVATGWMLPLCAVVLGAGLLLRGLAVAAEARDLAIADNDTEQAVFYGGLTAETVGGAAGLTLGIIALFNVTPLALCGVAAIIFGGALLIASGATGELARVPVGGTPQYREYSRQTTYGASGLEALTGLATLVLGIISVTSARSLTVTLVAYLIAGAAVMLAAAASGARFVPEARVHH